MILVVFGTTGELIKLAPVLLQLDERESPYVLATTGQQVQQIPTFLDQFGLRRPDIWFGRGSNGRDLQVNRDIPGWIRSVGRSFARSRGDLRAILNRDAADPLVLVHGDTMTTVLGAVMGHALGAPVAHIESGLRSYDLRHPFPEELNRKLASALARIHYAPSSWAAANVHGDVVDTGSNTIRDSLQLVPPGRPPFPLPDEPFGIASLHRFELLNSRRLMTATIDALAAAARRRPLIFIGHPVTVAAVDRFRLRDRFDETRLVLVPRLRFFDFVHVERRSAFVITDSGGSQEECYYLDIPCLVHRVRTERREGLGENAVLSELRIDALRDFLADPGRHRRRSNPPAASPSRVIVDDLARRGLA